MAKGRFYIALSAATLGCKLLFALFLLLNSVILSAQSEESPYSRYGLGTVVPPIFSANKGMGYLAAPYASAININSANPASYASLTRTTAEIGVNIDGVSIVANDTAHKGAKGGLSHFALAFVPPSKHDDQRFAIVLSLLPFSYVNYNFVQNFNDSVSGIGPYSQSYIGSGSLYQLFIGGAYKYKNFSIGANLGYLFGKLQYEKINSFPDTSGALNTREFTNMNVKGVLYNIGVQYQYTLYHNHEDPDPRKDIYAFFGAYGSGGLRPATKTSEYWDRYYYDANSSLIVVDTLKSVYNQKGKINLPFNLGLGAMFGNERFWMIGADFKYQNWAKYSTPLDNGGLSDNWQLSVGAQITPKYEDRNYLNNVQYRLGAYYGAANVVIAGKHLSQEGATVGFGFPLIRNTAHINFTGDFGSLGAPDKTIIRVNYYRFSIGFVLNDAWFIKRKFD